MAGGFGGLRRSDHRKAGSGDTIQVIGGKVGGN